MDSTAGTLARLRRFARSVGGGGVALDSGSWPGHLGIECGFMNRALTTTGIYANNVGSTMNASSDQFNPVVAQFPGFGSILPSAWKASWNTNDDNPFGNTIRVVETNLTPTAWASGDSNVADPQTPCPDSRGYWGDYDDLNLAGLDAAGHSTFIRFFTDSTASACSPWPAWTYYGSPAHISELTFQ